jgi:Skp family chaperone for outer membrane proteins
MALKGEYDSVDQVPEGVREHYTENNGKYVFAGVEGWVSPTEKKKLTDEAATYRIKLRETNGTLENFKKLRNHEGNPFEKAEDLQAILDEYPTLKAAAEAGGGKSKEAVAAQVEIEKKRLEQGFLRQANELNGKVTAAEQRIATYENRERQQAVRDVVVKAIGESKIGKLNPDAIEDVLLYAERHMEVDEDRDEHGNLVIKEVRTKDGVGVTPGLGAAAWLAEMQAKKGHWYMPSDGGGSNAGGRGGSNGGAGNPWSKDGWNVTAQGAYYREHGATKAEQMARAAGTVLGGPPPAGAAGNQPDNRPRARGRG